MVGTDLDGTLLRSDLTVGRRTRAVLAWLEARGVWVVPATARQVRGIAMLADQFPFSGWAVCSNGAVVTHLRTGEVLAEATLAPEAAQSFAAQVLAAVPGTVFFGVRDAGTTAAAEPGYRALAVYQDHKRNPDEWDVLAHDALLRLPHNKIAIRHPELLADELHRRVRELDLTEVTVAHSGAPFLDVTAAGVSKAWGLARLCEHLGVEADEVVAFGDELNDVEMLRWAGLAVAIEHAGASVHAVADRLAPSNDDDGIGRVLEDLVAEGRFGPVASRSG